MKQSEGQGSFLHGFAVTCKDWRYVGKDATIEWLWQEDPFYDYGI